MTAFEYLVVCASIPVTLVLGYIVGKSDFLGMAVAALNNHSDDMMFKRTRDKIADEVALKMTYMCGCRNCIEKVRSIILDDLVSPDNQCEVCPIQDCWVKDNVRVSYLCDGRYCSDGCTNTDCHHTEDIRHAKNFKCVEVGKWIEEGA